MGKETGGIVIFDSSKPPDPEKLGRMIFDRFLAVVKAAERVCFPDGISAEPEPGDDDPDMDRRVEALSVAVTQLQEFTIAAGSVVGAGGTVPIRGSLRVVLPVPGPEAEA